MIYRTIEARRFSKNLEDWLVFKRYFFFKIIRTKCHCKACVKTSAVRRLLPFVGSVKRISGFIYEETRGVLNVFRVGVYVLVCVCVCDAVRLALILNTVQYCSYSCKAVNHVSVLNDNKEQLPGESGTTRCRKYITGASKGEKWVSWDHFWNRDYILFLRRDMLKSITQMKVKCYTGKLLYFKIQHHVST